MIKKLLLLLSFLFFACAIQGPPSGGPVDRTPPEIVQTSLLPGTINVPMDLNEVQITFSERIKEGSERNNLFISPPLTLENSWKKGRILKIRFLEELKKDQTYVLTLGSGIQDLRNNKMAQSFSLAFSTGDSIDQGQITGKVYGLKQNETFNIFAYLLSDTSDFNPFETKPDYISQTGEEGSFALKFIKDGCYRLLAVEDRNHNFLLNALTERFAIAYQDVCLDKEKNVFSGLGLQLAKFDTIAPQIIDVKALFNDFIRVRFSEPVVLDSTLRVELIDSLNGMTIPIVQTGKNWQNANWFEILTQPLDSLTTYQIQFSQLKDSSGNVQQRDLIRYFKGTAKKDTSRLRLETYSPQDSAKNVRPETHIYFKFSLPVDWEQLSKHFKLTLGSGVPVKGAWKLNSLYDGAFVPSQNLKPDSQYVVWLPLRKVHDFRGQPCVDSLDSFTFFMVSNKELGEVSGNLNLKKVENPVILKLVSLSGKRLTLKTVLQGRNRFYFPFVPEGEYQLQGYVDQNRNGQFDSGKLRPFHFCEPFAFSPDTIQVRKRWETSGIQFNLPEIEE
ncbi:MAG: Ig-like domain-containing protein [Caldisericaceae bacterium]|nr:Ig-like domain-containing protein [Caldisericaceae bacterium]